MRPRGGYIKTYPKNASILTERGGFPTQWMASSDRYRVKTDQANFLLNTEGFIPYWEQIAYIDDLLKTVDWIITIEENRTQQFAGAPTQYPIGYAYYDKLKTQSLGFDMHKQFQTIPPLFHHPNSDPTVTSYDHPKVIIYKRTSNVNQKIASWREQVKNDPSLPDRAFFNRRRSIQKPKLGRSQNSFSTSS